MKNLRLLKSIWIALQILLFILAVLIFREIMILARLEKSYDDLRTTYHIATIPEPNDTAAPQVIEENNGFTVDFDGLREVNPDTVAWIRIPDTPVDYPIVQAQDNDYYLHRAFDGTYSSAGSLFLDARHDLASAVPAVIYGHNMGRTKTNMFSTLKNYQDADYLTQHPEIELYTPDGSSTWQIFSVIITDVANQDNIRRFYRMDTDISDTDYITTLQSLSIHKIPANLQEDSQVLILSTCLGTGALKSIRLLVIATETGGE